MPLCLMEGLWELQILEDVKDLLNQEEKEEDQQERQVPPVPSVWPVPLYMCGGGRIQYCSEKGLPIVQDGKKNWRYADPFGEAMRQYWTETPNNRVFVTMELVGLGSWAGINIYPQPGCPYPDFRPNRITDGRRAEGCHDHISILCGNQTKADGLTDDEKADWQAVKDHFGGRRHRTNILIRWITGITKGGGHNGTIAKGAFLGPITTALDNLREPHHGRDYLTVSF